jgi:hypothetical protein
MIEATFTTDDAFHQIVVNRWLRDVLTPQAYALMRESVLTNGTALTALAAIAAWNLPAAMIPDLVAGLDWFQNLDTLQKAK